MVSRLSRLYPTQFTKVYYIMPFQNAFQKRYTTCVNNINILKFRALFNKGEKYEYPIKQIYRETASALTY